MFKNPSLHGKKLTCFLHCLILIQIFVASLSWANEESTPYELTNEQKQSILDTHNDARSRCANGESGYFGPKFASNMQSLFWDPGLEAMAKKRSGTCYGGHFGGSGQINSDFRDVRHLLTFVPTSRPAGENVAIYNRINLSTEGDKGRWDNAVEAWHKEGDLYFWDTNTCYDSTCGHWAQVCSANTRYVGCAVTRCEDGIGGNVDYSEGYQVTCNYWPSVDAGQPPFEDALNYDFCFRCQQYDTQICGDNVCKGGKSSKWLSSGLIDSNIDTCTDGLGRDIKPCRLAPTINMSVTPKQGSVPLTVDFKGWVVSNDSKPEAESYYWDFGDGTVSHEKEPTHTYTAPGTYNVTLLMMSDIHQVSTTPSKVIVSGTGNSAPQIDFSLEHVMPGYSEGVVNERDAVSIDASNSRDYDGTIENWHWEQITGAPVAMTGQGTSKISFVAPDISLSTEDFLFKLAATDNSGIQVSKIILIKVDDSSKFRKFNKPPIAEFIRTPFSGNSPLLVSFDSSSTSDEDGSITSYLWEFGDGQTSTLASPEHTYTEAGSYMVYLNVTDNAGATHRTFQTVTVLNESDSNALPVAAFTVSDSAPATAPATVTFDGSTSLDTDGTIESWAWDFGDSEIASGEVVEHTFEIKGVYEVSLTVTDNNGASATISKTIKVETDGVGEPDTNQSPVAVFAPSETNLDYVPATVTFDASQSSDPDGDIVTWSWNFGGNNNATGKVVDHTFSEAGTYQVTLTVTDDKGATNTSVITITIEVPAENQPPVASFTPSETNLNGVPATVTFDASQSSDSDGEIVSWSWNFEGNNNATGEVVSYTFAEAGSYPVTLTVTDDQGATDSSVVTIVIENTVEPDINEPPVATFTSSKTNIVGVPATVTFDASPSSDPDGEIVSWVWSFGGSNNASGKVVDYTYTEAGTYLVTLTVTDDKGATHSSVTTIVIENTVEPDINQPPVADFSAIEKELTEDSASLTFDGTTSTDLDGSIVSWSWNFGNSANVSGKVIEYFFTKNGTYLVTLTVADDKGATNTKSKLITIELKEPADPTDGKGVPTEPEEKADSAGSGGGALFISYLLLLAGLLIRKTKSNK